MTFMTLKELYLFTSFTVAIVTISVAILMNCWFRNKTAFYGDVIKAAGETMKRASKITEGSRSEQA